MLLMPPVAPNHFKWQIRRGFTPTITEEIVFVSQLYNQMYIKYLQTIIFKYSRFRAKHGCPLFQWAISPSVIMRLM